jgi:purine nucleoside phosphorylase
VTNAQHRPEVRDLTELLIASDAGVRDRYKSGSAKETIFHALSMMDEAEASIVLTTARTLNTDALAFALKVIRDHTDMFGSTPLVDEQDVSDRHKDMAAKMSCELTPSSAA